MTVHGLRKAGYKVRVLHFRKVGDTHLGAVSDRGGETVVQVTTPDGTELEGRAVCSDKDRYNKRVGVSVALGRAMFGLRQKPTVEFRSVRAVCFNKTA